MNQLIEFSPTPVYYANDRAFKEKWPIICNEGGSRSSKTYSLVQLLVKESFKRKHLRTSFVSHSLPHIKRGVLRDFKQIMHDFSLWKDWKFSKTDFIYTFSMGNYIEFFGLEDESKARGPSRDILFMNEANLNKKNLFDQLRIRTTETIILDYNPAEFNSWVYKIADDPATKLIKSTYKNNISNLTPAQVHAIESYKTLADTYMWDVFGLGKRGASIDLIYTNYKVYDYEVYGDEYFGLDFGFVNPCALVKVVTNEDGNYIQQKIYESGLKTPQLIEKLNFFVPKDTPIYADNAEPDTIAEIRDSGFNIYPADKNVWPGIMKVKSTNMYIHVDSRDILNEIGQYKWDTKSDGTLLDKPLKKDDHACDSFRYAIFTHSNRLINLPLII